MKMQSKVARVAAHASNTAASQILMLRKAKGWTQKQLAEKCGMRQSQISALEDPNRLNFEAATLIRIAAAFDAALTIHFITETTERIRKNQRNPSRKNCRRARGQIISPALVISGGPHPPK